VHSRALAQAAAISLDQRGWSRRNPHEVADGQVPELPFGAAGRFLV
jgi:hypothetical protein